MNSTKTTNPYCDALRIPVPRLESAKKHPDANYFSLLIVALLERGKPMTLEEAARRFEEAGVASKESALASLKRCKPGRAPIYRDGNLYALDPHDDETAFWAFRLDLRPAREPEVTIVRPDPGPLPSVDEPLTRAHLDEAWRDGVPSDWSAQRIAICVLDAHGGAMLPGEVLAFVASRGRSQLTENSAHYWRQGAIRFVDDGSWELDRCHKVVPSARQAILNRITVARRWAHQRPDPVVIQAYQKRHERESQTNADRLAALCRVIVHAFPPSRPEAVVLLDVQTRKLSTYLGPQIAEARVKLATYDHIAAVNLRPLLRNLDFDPGDRRLAELGPPQKTITLNRQRRTLRITPTLLVQGSCGITHPFGDELILRDYLNRGQLTRLRRRLESDARSLFALYQYGRLHRTVRIRWGFLDEIIPAPWVHSDEPALHNLKQEAFDKGFPLEIVLGSAPGWDDPWARARLARVVQGEREWELWIVDEAGWTVDEVEIQMARLATEGGGGLEGPSS
jgi:hypothetical protein